jgi:hypothetical protein
MSLVCFSKAVWACMRIRFHVMFHDPVAKSTSMIRPVAAEVLFDMFARLPQT